MARGIVEVVAICGALLLVALAFPAWAIPVALAWRRQRKPRPPRGGYWEHP